MAASGSRPVPLKAEAQKSRNEIPSRSASSTGAVALKAVVLEEACGQQDAAPEPLGKKQKLNEDKGLVNDILVDIKEGSLLPSGVQVLNVGTCFIHIWGSGVYSLCNRWRCGTPDSPAASAKFAKSMHEFAVGTNKKPCYFCYSSKLYPRVEENKTGQVYSDNEDDTNSESDMVSHSAAVHPCP